MAITHEEVRRILSYDPETGVFTWIQCAAPQILPGTIAGNRSGRYRRIETGGKAYLAHRLAWFWMTGAWPTKRLDHRNGDTYDNSWSNLREATLSQNQHNSRKRTITGHKCVFKKKDRPGWEVRIRNGSHYFYKYCLDENEAIAIADTQRVLMHGAFSNHG